MKPDLTLRDAHVVAVNADGSVTVTFDTDPGPGHLCVGWVPRADGTTPGPGDRALVVEGDAGTLWLAAWRPVGETMPPSPS